MGLFRGIVDGTLDMSDYNGRFECSLKTFCRFCVFMADVETISLSSENSEYRYLCAVSTEGYYCEKFANVLPMDAPLGLRFALL